MHRAIAPITGLLALGCGGLGLSGDEVHALLDPACAAPAVSPPDLALVELDQPPATLHWGPQVALLADGTVRASGAPVDDLAAALAAFAADAASVGERLGRPPERELQLAVEATVPVERVIDVLGQSASAGLDDVVLVGFSTTPLTVPAPPDPELAARVRAELDALPPSDRVMRLSALVSDAIAWCPGAISTFSGVANADPDSKCRIMAMGLAESLPSCPLTDPDTVLTLFVVAVTPQPQRYAATARIAAAPASDPTGPDVLRVAPGAAWRDVLPRIASSPTPVRWLIPAP